MPLSTGQNCLQLLLLCGVLVACGGGSGGNNGEPTQPSSPAAAEQAEQLTTESEKEPGTGLSAELDEQQQPEPLPPLELVNVAPKQSSEYQPLYQHIRLEFNHALASESISPAHFSLLQTYTDFENNSIQTAIPFRIETGQTNHVLFLYPLADYRKNASISVSVAPGLLAANGVELIESTGFEFFTQLDTEGPIINAVSPLSGTINNDLYPTFTITMSDPVLGLEQDFVTDAVLYEKKWSSYSGYVRKINTRILVNGDTLSITPIEPLNYDNGYELRIAALPIHDEYGNALKPWQQSAFYKTKQSPVSVKFPSGMSNVYYDAQTHTLLAFSFYRQLLFQVTFNGEPELTSRGLPENPFDACFDDNGRLYVSFENSSRIRVYDAQSMTLLGEFDWTDPTLTAQQLDSQIWQTAPYIHCVGDAVYVSIAFNGNGRGAINKVQTSAPHTVTQLADSANINDIVRLSTNELLALRMKHSGTPSKELAFLSESASTLVEMDTFNAESINLSLPRLGHAPLLVDESSRQVFLGNHILNMDDLATTQQLLPSGVLAIDPERRRFYSTTGVYSMDTYEQLLGAIVPESYNAEFDKHGNLLLYNNTRQLLHVISEHALSTRNAGQ